MEGELTLGNGAHIRTQMFVSDLLYSPPDPLDQSNESTAEERDIGVLPRDDSEEEW